MSLQQAIPVLRIFDQEKALAFYIDFLGFEVDWQHRFEPHFPVYMQVSRQHCVLHLSEHHGDGTPGGAIRIGTDNIRVLHAELSVKEYKYAHPGIQEQPWGHSEIIIKDPFGNTIIFFQPH